MLTSTTRTSATAAAPGAKAPHAGPGEARRVPGPFQHCPGPARAHRLREAPQRHVASRASGPQAQRGSPAPPRPAGLREGKGGEGRAALSCAGTCRAGAGAPAAAQGEVEAGRGAQHSPAGSGGAERGSLPHPAGGGRAARAAAGDPRGRGSGDAVRGDAAIFPPRHSNSGTAPARRRRHRPTQSGRWAALRPRPAAGRLGASGQRLR